VRVLGLLVALSFAAQLTAASLSDHYRHQNGADTRLTQCTRPRTPCHAIQGTLLTGVAALCVLQTGTCATPSANVSSTTTTDGTTTRTTSRPFASGSSLLAPSSTVHSHASHIACTLHAVHALSSLWRVHCMWSRCTPRLLRTLDMAASHAPRPTCSANERRRSPRLRSRLRPRLWLRERERSSLVGARGGGRGERLHRGRARRRGASAPVQPGVHPFAGVCALFHISSHCGMCTVCAVCTVHCVYCRRAAVRLWSTWAASRTRSTCGTGQLSSSRPPSRAARGRALGGAIAPVASRVSCCLRWCSVRCHVSQATLSHAMALFSPPSLTQATPSHDRHSARCWLWAW
jgi:hypothetical protein